MNYISAFFGLIIAFLIVPTLTTLLVFWLYIHHGSSDVPAKKLNIKPPVSVIIPTYNEEDIIETKLEDVIGLSYPIEKIELVLVDSSDDNTVDVVKEFLEDKPLTLTVVKQKTRRGVAGALNDGVSSASNEIIIRTDADSLLTDDTLHIAVSTLDDPEIGAVTGQQVDVLGGSAVETDYRNFITLLQQIETQIDSTYICHGPCFAFEKGVYEPIPDDTIADDTEAGIRIRESGHRVVLNPEMGFVESGASEFQERRQRKDRRAAGLLQVLIRHRNSLGRYGKFGSVVLPLYWLLLLGMPWSLLGLITSVLGLTYTLAGLVGLLPIALIGVFVWLGGREKLGLLQPIYAIVDSQFSLIGGAVSLIIGRADPIWELDRESRELFR